MNKNFLDKSDFYRSALYEKPILVTMSGAPGSGKSVIARTLSSSLNLYLLSNDYVRNYFLQEFGSLDIAEIQRRVRKINDLRLIKLLLGRVSIVMDASIDSLSQSKQLELLCKILRYRMIKIRIEASEDRVNIDRIKRRVMDYDMKFPGVLGDKVKYSTSYNEEEYYRIKAEKQLEIPIESFDYVIHNSDNDADYLLSQINEMCEKIGSGLVRKKSYYKSYL